MSQTNLLDIVPDQLFQTHSISDIDQVQKKLQYEIERKKEELRAMVGERYRDLIHAADTIEEMKVTTASTLNHIGEMMAACRNLHNTHLVGFKIEDKPSMAQSLQTSTFNPVHGISVQVKLLMEIPEKIWTCIEAEDYVKATQLFIMARHVNTGLELQMGGKNAKPGMQSLQRLVQQQWNSISNFNQTIISVCRGKLQDIDISVEIACSCLISLYLLDSQSMVELLNSLIALQSNSSLKSTLQFDLSKILEGDLKVKIREKVVNGVKIVLKTVVLVYSCFVDNDGGAVLAKLRELFRKDSQPLLDLVHFSDPHALKLLPSVILNYRLTSKKEVEPLPKEEITKCVQKWSVWVKSFIDDNVKTLLQNITRVKILHEIREEAFKIETPPNWTSICSSLDIPEVHVWCHYFQPLLTSRVKMIIDNRWLKIYDAFKTQLLIDLTKVSESDLEKESNINWFVWKDLIGETIIESRSEVVKVMNSLMQGMSRQDRGFTPNLEKLCLALDSELQKLLEDLKIYLYQDKKNTNAKQKLLFVYDEEDDSDQIYSDKAEIEIYLRDVSSRNIQSMLQYIKACFEEPTLQSNELQKKTTAIYTARFTQATVALTPHLRKCYIPENFNHLGVISIDEDAMKSWNEVCGVLKKNCLFCWSKWIDIVMVKVEELTKGLPQEFTLEANIDYLMMQWDVIKIEEKDDEGTAIESIIKVPAGPSLKLQEYLYSVSRILDEVVPHTLPIEIHTCFIEKLTAITFAHFDKVIREKEMELNQRCALQLLMDIRHLTLLLIPRENKKSMEFSHDICEFLRQKIDPFDYDVFYPYIQTNLKRSVQRVQTLQGSLILHHGQLTGIIGTKPVLSGGSGDKAAMLLATSDSHWFSLLPVAAPPSTFKKQDKPAKKKQVSASPSKTKSELSDLMTSSLPINFANARSGAASFFNSMTSDWFSGS